MAAGVLLLVCAGALLYSAEAQDPYDELPGLYQKGVDLALDQLNAHDRVLLHFRFMKSLEKTEKEIGFGMKFLYHHFNLRPTTCAKGTTDSSPQNCPFRSDRPLMDCTVCYKAAGDQMEATPKPYVDCIQKPRFTLKMKAARLDHCRKMIYNHGAPTLLAVSTG